LDSGFEPGGVGEHLSKVVVVGLFELVLNDNLVVGGGVRGDDVGGVRAHCHLHPVEFQLQIQRIGEASKVLLLGEPRSEISGLIGPDGAEVNGFERAEGGIHRSLAMHLLHEVVLRNFHRPIKTTVQI
jgi:hypothetical protein